MNQFEKEKSKVASINQSTKLAFLSHLFRPPKAVTNPLYSKSMLDETSTLCNPIDLLYWLFWSAHELLKEGNVQIYVIQMKEKKNRWSIFFRARLIAFLDLNKKRKDEIKSKLFSATCDCWFLYNRGNYMEQHCIIFRLLNLQIFTWDVDKKTQFLLTFLF